MSKRLRAQLTGLRIWFGETTASVFAQLKGHEYLQERGPLTKDDVARLTEELHKQRLVHTCLTCVNWIGNKEVCRLAPQHRPPAHVIAYGCPAWQDHENGHFTPSSPVSLR